MQNGLCHNFLQKGDCDRANCPYRHVKPKDDSKENDKTETNKDEDKTDKAREQCRDFLAGACTRNPCRFAHGDVPGTPSAWREPSAKGHRGGGKGDKGGGKGDKGKGKGRSASPASEPHSTGEPCWWYTTERGCRLGDRCRNMHPGNTAETDAPPTLVVTPRQCQKQKQKVRRMRRLL